MALPGLIDTLTQLLARRSLLWLTLTWRRRFLTQSNFLSTTSLACLSGSSLIVLSQSGEAFTVDGNKHTHTWKQEIICLFDVERYMSIGKKAEDGDNLFFKELANRFWSTSKSYSWFNKVAHCEPSIKRTSWKGKWNVAKGRLDLEFVKKITLEMVSGQQMKQWGHG